MKTYLKDLTPEEVIKRLKNGGIIKFDNNDTFHIKMIDGIICRIYGNNFVINGGFDNEDFYFETEEHFEIKETGLYKTRDGRKVFVSKIYDNCIIGLIDNDEELMNWNSNGFVFDDEREENQDIIGKWEEILPNITPNITGKI